MLLQRFTINRMPSFAKVVHNTIAFLRSPVAGMDEYLRQQWYHDPSCTV
jgi:hypothetical protein